MEGERQWEQEANDLIEQAVPAFDAAFPLLSQLLKAELAERQVRSIACQMKTVGSQLIRTSPVSTLLPAR